MEIVGILTSKELDKMYDSFSTMQTEATDVLESLWEGLKALVSTFVSLDLVYDPDLCSKIDTFYFLNEYGLSINSETKANSLAMVINHLCHFVESFTTFASDLVTLKITRFFRDIANIMNDGVNLLNSIKSVGSSLSYFVTTLVKDPAQFFSNLCYVYYLNTTLPCRTDYEKFGEKIEFEDHTNVVSGLPIINDLVSVFSIAESNRSADSKMFAGAELEYLFVGSNDEIRNQSVVFLMLYVFRIIGNITALRSPEVTALAVGPQAPLVYLLYILIEPFVDVVLLVNGSEVPLFKTTPYLSIKGIPKAVSSLCKIATLEKYKEKIQRSFANIIGYTGSFPSEDKEDGNYFEELFEFDYKEYLLLIMFIFQNEKNELGLFRNIIQMETLEYNRKNNLLYPYFDIRKTYTALESETEAQVKEFMPQIMSDSVFKVKRTQYRCY